MVFLLFTLFHRTTLNEKILTKFYTAFANGDVASMCECYDSDIQFQDPAFGLLKGSDVCTMWKMLLEKSNGTIKIEFSNIKADEYRGHVKWIATYPFSKTKRIVVNHVRSEFQFKNGLIYRQIDYFDIWKWSKQAFGFTGYMFGWTGYFQRKIEEKALASLKKYKNAN